MRLTEKLVMKLDKISIKGFLTHKHKRTINFDKYNFIIGPNGAGKTSIRNAIEWVLTGQTRMTKGSQIAEKYLITDDPDTDKAQVSAYFNNQDHFAKRDITDNRPSRITTKYQGKEIPSGPKSPTKTESEEALLNGLGLTENLVHYLLDGKDFATLNASDRAEVMAELFSANSMSKAKNHIDFNELEGDSKEIIEEYSNSFNLIDQATDQLIEDRRASKRDKKSYQSKLDEIDDKLPDSVEVLGKEYPGRYAINNLDEIEEKIEQHKEELAELKGQHKVAGKSLEKIEQEIKELKNKKGKHSEKKLREKKSEIKTKIKALKNRVSRAESGETTCVYDSSCACPVDDQKISDFKTKAENKIEKLRDKGSTLSDNISKTKQINKKIEKLKNKKESAIKEEKLEKMNEFEEDIKEAKQKYDKLIEIRDDKAREEDLKKKVEQKENEVDNVNKAIDIFEQAREDILNKALEEYREYLDKASEIFKQKFKLTDDMDILFEGRPYYALSQSEKLRLQYVNQLALALVTDANFAAFDEVGTLFGNNRIKLLRLLEYYNDSLDFAMIILSSDIDKPPIKEGKIIKA